VAAGDPRSYDLPDFRALGDGPYPPILLEAMDVFHHVCSIRPVRMWPRCGLPVARRSSRWLQGRPKVAFELRRCCGMVVPPTGFEPVISALRGRFRLYRLVLNSCQ